MHYYLYQITNKVNGKIYVGVHKTRRLDDGYMGSGKVVRAAMEKHGAHNFTKVILEHFEDSKSMYAREAEIVDDAFLARDDVYNLRRGGSGGFDYLNTTGQNRHHGKENTFSNPAIGRMGANRCRELSIGAFFDPTIRNRGWLSEEHRLFAVKRATSDEANLSRSTTMKKLAAQPTYQNSQAGTMWITDGVINKKIKKHDPIPEGCRKGRV